MAQPLARVGLSVRIFYDHVQYAAEKNNRQDALVLAHVIAHEIGHVLLRSNAHSGARPYVGHLDKSRNTRRSRKAPCSSLPTTPAAAHLVPVDGWLARVGTGFQGQEARRIKADGLVRELFDGRYKQASSEMHHKAECHLRGNHCVRQAALRVRILAAS
jgi:hypothetical protein